MISLKTKLNLTITEQFEIFKNFNELPDCEVTVEKNKDKNEFFQNLKAENTINTFSFKTLNGEYVLTNAFCSAVLSADYKKISVYVSDDAPPYQSTKSIILQLYKYTCINSGGILIHSACVEFNKNAVLFCGLSGAGKSTQAHLWEKFADAKPINLDQPYIFVKDGKSYVCGSPFSGKESAYEPICVPVRGIIFVNQAKENSIKKLSNAECFSQLYLNNYTYPINKTMDKRFNENITELATFTDMFTLNCDISKKAVSVCMTELFGKEATGILEIKRYIRNNEFSVRKIKDKDILCKIKETENCDNKNTVLNESGVFIWNLLNTEYTAEQIAKKLCEEYLINYDTAITDTGIFIDKCLKENFVAEV